MGNDYAGHYNRGYQQPLGGYGYNQGGYSQGGQGYYQNTVPMANTIPQGNLGYGGNNFNMPPNNFNAPMIDQNGNPIQPGFQGQNYGNYQGHY